MAFGEIGEYLPGARIPRKFVCDTEADVASLPECMTGSTAVIVNTADVYVVNANGKWVKLGAGA